MYDRSAGQWRALPEMSVAPSGCAAVCIDGNVYVVGGKSGGAMHASVERYDPVANEFRALPSMGTVRWNCAAVACGPVSRPRLRLAFGRGRTGYDRGARAQAALLRP
jgi:hypothetical protein